MLHSTNNEARREGFSRNDIVATLGLPPKRCADGFTLLELIVVIIVVAIFAAILLGRFLLYQELAEKASMEQTAGAVRSALNIQVAGLIARGGTQEIPKLATLNPVIFLNEKQKNYVGEFYEAALEDIPPGSWYFDLKHKELVYLVHSGEYFVPDEKGDKRVRFKVDLVYNENLLPSAAGAERRELGGVVLKEVVPYTWDVR